MSEFNKENVGTICDHIIRALGICMKNKDVWTNDKYQMIKLIQNDNEIFYEVYPRICHIIVFSDDITPLLGMIKTFGRVQAGELSFNDANNSITTALNAKYVDNVLNSDKLKEERDRKIKEKVQDI